MNASTTRGSQLRPGAGPLDTPKKWAAIAEHGGEKTATVKKT